MTPTEVVSPIDLAARWLGAGVLEASDESFGLKENLLVSTPPAFVPGHYDHRGEIVDGWETRRRRQGDHDWVLVRLGAPGRIEQIDVDTSYFTGNFPATTRVEAIGREGYPSVNDLLGPGAVWTEIVPMTPLAGDVHNLLPVASDRRFTHLRVNAYPDGGIARLRVHGVPIPDPRQWDGVSVELSSVRWGGRVVRSSDDFYTSAAQLIRPDLALTMGEGWETARRRTGGNDSVEIAFGVAGRAERIEVDTTHFKYNATAEFELWGSAGGIGESSVADWFPLLPRTALQPDTVHSFRLSGAAVTAVRLDAFPDGGIARVRVLGQPTPDAVAAARTRFHDALPTAHAERIATL